MSATYLNAGPVSNVWARAAGTSAKETAARTSIMPIFKSHTPPPGLGACKIRARSEDRPRAASSRRYINTKSRAAARRYRSGARAARVQKFCIPATVSRRYAMLERRRLAASAPLRKNPRRCNRGVQEARGVHRVKSVARTKSACSDAAARSIFARRGAVSGESVQNGLSDGFPAAPSMRPASLAAP